jgi:hypothetical protein
MPFIHLKSTCAQFYALMWDRRMIACVRFADIAGDVLSDRSRSEANCHGFIGLKGDERVRWRLFMLQRLQLHGPRSETSQTGAGKGINPTLQEAGEKAPGTHAANCSVNKSFCGSCGAP